MCMPREDGGHPRMRVEQGGQVTGALEHVGVGQRVVERDGRLVKGDQGPCVLRQFGESRIDPGEGPLVEAPLVAPRDRGVAHQDRDTRDVVHPVDGSGVGGLTQQRLPVRGAGVMVSGAREDREGRGQDPRGLLVLRLRAVVRDVAGDQQGVDGAGQGPQVIHDAYGATGRPLTAVQVQVTDLCEQHGHVSP